jgi:phage FluMu protein Com
MNCIECGKPLAEDADERTIRHPECCWQSKSGTWRCHICGHLWKPTIMHQSVYGYFFSHCPKCTSKVEEPVKEWYHSIRISTGMLSFAAMASSLSIGPALVFAPNQRWLIILLFVILLLSIIGFIVKGIRDHHSEK